ncbi:MAG: ligase-associated DNA damage response endonuclease PdeM [Gemmobacter sp.]|uniref:ligase-associated DNA damage response endonuclease PdeM n=1 Tax=Gemmobacter sp. TaxID=1898957 RepID=UPI001A54E13F|nr:ligase-associated DNA damage response endonuclease PdeM [Gemmobacter sp.]MBL8562492.1 ligase-associated DNA damage response endonuclease PdeM [Gemmobacter sp.]
MSSHAFDLGGARLEARASGALFWADQGLLVVSDLHFGKAQRLARRGGALLPPYETQATLARLEAELQATGAAQVICLGDSFDDLTAASELAEAERDSLLRLMDGRDWLWIEGNHDPAPTSLGGQHRAEITLAGLTFRHMAETGGTGAEISGHYHPKARLAGRAAPCFLLNPAAGRLILPAFGTYTGGLACDAAALVPLMQAPGALAILTGRTARAIPYSAALYSAARGSASPVPGASTRPRATSRSR